MLDTILSYILVPVAHAQSQDIIPIGTLMARINRFVLNPIIGVMFVVAFVVFVYGLFQFFQDREGKSGADGGLGQGKQHIVWGIIGMVIMVSVFGIMQFIINSFGIQGINPNSPEIGDLSQE